LLDRKVIDIFLTFTERNRIYRGLIDWIGFNKKALIFDALPNPDGRTPSYNYNKLTQLAVDSITSFSVRPLKIIAYIGVLIVALSIFTLIIMLITIFAMDNRFGFTNLAVIVVANTFLV
jgi:polyisoprenyl-phosphate glycosyltransferase